MQNSTEKLLDVIRTPETNRPKLNFSTPAQKISQLISTKVIKKNTLQLGILIGEDRLTITLVGEKGQNRRKILLKWAVVKLPQGMGIDDDHFPSFVGSALTEVTEGVTGIGLWCHIPAEHAKLRTFSIPDLPDHKLANAAFWGLKKELEFDAESEIFDFHILADMEIGGRKTKQVLGCIAQKSQVETLKALFKKVGYAVQGITALPFAIQNFIHSGHLVPGVEGLYSIVNLTEENSEMFCYSGSGLLLARKIRTDLYSLFENLKQLHNISGLETLLSAEGKDNPDLFQIRQSCERLIDKIVRTGEYCSQNFAGNTPVNKIIFLGEAPESTTFLDLVENRTTAEIQKFKPVFDTLPGTVEVELPKDHVKKNQVYLSFGMACSEIGVTPNFIHTHSDRKIEQKEKKINLAAAAGLISIIAACIVLFFWQSSVYQAEKDRLKTITEKRNTLSSDMSLSETVAQVTRARQMLSLKKDYIQTYFALAVINEITQVTPETVDLSFFSSDFSEKDDPKTPATTKKLKNKKRIELSGRVRSGTKNPENELTSYMLKLGESRLLSGITILQRTTSQDNYLNGLEFRIAMDIKNGAENARL